MLISALASLAVAASGQRVQRPLFHARLIAVALSQSTTLRDVRRDGRAVGVTSDHGPDWVRSYSLLVFGGRAVTGDGPGETGASQWTTYPVAITGSNSFVIAFESYPSRKTHYRKGSLRNGQIVLGGRTSGPFARARSLAPSSSETIAFLRELWPQVTGRRNLFPSQAGVRWTALKGNLKVGHASGEPMSADGDGPFHYETYSSALVKDPNGISLLASRTLNAPPSGLAEVLWVAPEGWIVCRAGDGLAWLEPLPVSTKRKAR